MPRTLPVLSKEAEPTSHPLLALLDVDETFAVTTFEGSPKRKYPASDAVVDALDSVTTAGAMLLVAGCMLWVARRLEKVTDVTRCRLAAEALLCFQDHPAYFRPANLDEWPAAPKPTNDAERMVKAVCDQLWAIYAISPGRHPLPPRAIEIAGVTVTMVRAVLGKGGTKPFEAWLAAMLERLKEVASNPRAVARAKLPDLRFDWNVERNFKRENVGPPLPPALIDVRTGPDATTLGALYANFLGSVDWSKNPFLASPEVMQTRTFQGAPYVPTPGAVYPSSATPGPANEETTGELAPASSPYPFLATLDAMPEAERPDALRTYLARRGLPASFDRRALLLEHAFRVMLRKPVMEAPRLHIGVLEASIEVAGDLSILVDDTRPRVPALRRFEPTIEVFEVDTVKEILARASGARRPVEPATEPSIDRIAIRAGDTLLARVTRKELAAIVDDLHDHVSEVRMIAPSDGTLFDAIRYMVQQEAEPWGMSNILSTSDMVVERVDGKLEAALAAVEDEDLAQELSAFCDATGRSARAWRWTGEDRTRPGEPKLRFVAGVYDGEGVGFEFNVYEVEEP